MLALIMVGRSGVWARIGTGLGLSRSTPTGQCPAARSYFTKVLQPSQMMLLCWDQACKHRPEEDISYSSVTITESAQDSPLTPEHLLPQAVNPSINSVPRLQRDSQNRAKDSAALRTSHQVQRFIQPLTCDDGVDNT